MDDDIWETRAVEVREFLSADTPMERVWDMLTDAEEDNGQVWMRILHDGPLPRIQRRLLIPSKI